MTLDRAYLPGDLLYGLHGPRDKVWNHVKNKILEAKKLNPKTTPSRPYNSWPGLTDDNISMSTADEYNKLSSLGYGYMDDDDAKNDLDKVLTTWFHRLLSDEAPQNSYKLDKLDKLFPFNINKSAYKAKTERLRHAIIRHPLQYSSWKDGALSDYLEHILIRNLCENMLSHAIRRGVRILFILDDLKLKLDYGKKVDVTQSYTICELLRIWELCRSDSAFKDNILFFKSFGESSDSDSDYFDFNEESNRYGETLDLIKAKAFPSQLVCLTYSPWDSDPNGWRDFVIECQYHPVLAIHALVSSILEGCNVCSKEYDTGHTILIKTINDINSISTTANLAFIQKKLSNIYMLSDLDEHLNLFLAVFVQKLYGYQHIFPVLFSGLVVTDSTTVTTHTIETVMDRLLVMTLPSTPIRKKHRCDYLLPHRVMSQVNDPRLQRGGPTLPKRQTFWQDSNGFLGKVKGEKKGTVAN